MKPNESQPILEPLTSVELEELRALVAKILSHTSPWGTLRGGERIESNSISMPWWEMSEPARQSMRWLYDHDRIVWFDWGNWDEGREITRTWSDETAMSLDHLTVRKLLTAVARNDRFCEGAWVGLFERGRAQPLFARLLEHEEALAATN